MAVESSVVALRRRSRKRSRFALVISQDKKDPGDCFVCTCAHPLANSGAANTGDTGAPAGDLPQREKNSSPATL